MLRNVFGEGINTRYFDEHNHIDEHHGRMALDRVIAPAVERMGEPWLNDVVRGFEEIKMLQEMADRDIIEQICFSDRLFKAQLAGEYCNVDEGIWGDSGTDYFGEEANELSVTHIHDTDELFQVIEGSLDFTAGATHSITLSDGDSIVIPAGRLHGTKVTSPMCKYRVRQLPGIGISV